MPHIGINATMVLTHPAGPNHTNSDLFHDFLRVLSVVEVLCYLAIISRGFSHALMLGPAKSALLEAPTGILRLAVRGYQRGQASEKAPWLPVAQELSWLPVVWCRLPAPDELPFQ
jgi:hypothetical protein